MSSGARSRGRKGKSKGIDALKAVEAPDKSPRGMLREARWFTARLVALPFLLAAGCFSIREYRQRVRSSVYTGTSTVLSML